MGDWLAIAGHEGLDATYSQCRPQAGGVDRAFCWNTFTLPPNMAAGYYGVMWWWEFNGGEHYNSCAGLQVVGTAAELTSPPAPPPPPAAPSPNPGDPAPQPSCPQNPQTNANCPGQQNAAPDCRNDHNCCHPNFACYQKNSDYSGCRPVGTCEPGQIFDRDEQRFQTPWDCTYLGGECDAEEQAAVNAFQAANPSQSLSPADRDLYMQEFGDPAAMSMQVAMEAAANNGGMTPAMPVGPIGGAPVAPVQGTPGAPSAPGAGGAGVSSACKVVGSTVAVVAAMLQLC